MSEVTIPVTVLDIKAEVHESCNIACQKRLVAGTKGRQLFDIWSSVIVQMVPVQCIKTHRIVFELRTAYRRIN